jgi:citrate lyase subunit beta/citryl-CoA lyase
MRLLRSLLFVPGNNERMLQRAGRAGADAIVVDLEDAVPAGEKRAARALVRRELARLAADGAPVFVRVSDVRSGRTREDVRAAVRAGLTGIVLAKAEQPQDLRHLDVLIREAELARGIRPGDIVTIPLIESPRAVLRCEEIARASDRVVALSVGGEDYSAALGVRRDPGGAALAHLRNVVVTVAAAYELAAIDTPYADFKDEAGLRTECGIARALGFSGKYVIHPAQVPAVHEAFSPSAAEVADAKRIVAAAGAGAKRGRGAVNVDGRMVDAPVVARARRVIELAAGIEDGGR